MSRAAAESLKALGLEKHQALIVAHRDGHPYVHRDREPGRRGEREGGGVEPQQGAPLEVGGRIRAGAGADPVREESRQQREARARRAEELEELRPVGPFHNAPVLVRGEARGGEVLGSAGLVDGGDGAVARAGERADALDDLVQHGDAGAQRRILGRRPVVIGHPFSSSRPPPAGG